MYCRNVHFIGYHGNVMEKNNQTELKKKREKMRKIIHNFELMVVLVTPY